MVWCGVVVLVVWCLIVFFSGSAGTGKSHLLHTLISKCLPQDGTVSPTSTTGITATHISGLTLYAWSGIGGGNGGDDACLQRVHSNRDAMERWRRVQTLIIDEVSMLSADVFHALEYVAHNVRPQRRGRGRPDRPFGGIQLICTGDFFQLPPVSGGSSASGRGAQFCFESDSWRRCIQYSMELTHVFRQSDQLFVSILNDIRRGVLTAEAVKILSARAPTAIEKDSKSDSSTAAGADGIIATVLETRKASVDAMNHQRLELLAGGEPKEFRAKESGVKYLLDQLKNSCPARPVLSLKVGAQVILLKNINVSAGLCNGSRGVITRFITDAGAGAGSGRVLPVVRFATSTAGGAGSGGTGSGGSGGGGLKVKEHIIKPELWTIKLADKSSAALEQIPLDLAWSISVHKSQGMSLDRAKINLSNVFEFGQAYVALSRVRSLSGLEVTGLDRTRSVRAHPRVKEFYSQLAANAPALDDVPPLLSGKPSLTLSPPAPVPAPAPAPAPAPPIVSSERKINPPQSQPAVTAVSAADPPAPPPPTQNETGKKIAPPESSAPVITFSVLRASNGAAPPPVPVAVTATAAIPKRPPIPTPKPKAPLPPPIPDHTTAQRIRSPQSKPTPSAATAAVHRPPRPPLAALTLQSNVASIVRPTDSKPNRTAPAEKATPNPFPKPAVSLNPPQSTPKSNPTQPLLTTNPTPPLAAPAPNLTRPVFALSIMRRA